MEDTLANGMMRDSAPEHEFDCVEEIIAEAPTGSDSQSFWWFQFCYILLFNSLFCLKTRPYKLHKFETSLMNISMSWND